MNDQGFPLGAPPVTPFAAAPEHAQSPPATVTSGTPAAERKRQQRERERLAKRQTYFSRTDWSLFLNPRTISQKAGCQSGDLRKLALRELVDNGADAGAKVIIYPEGDGWIISDDGPGLDPDDVPHLFSVNRTLVSSKQLRLPTRGRRRNPDRLLRTRRAPHRRTGDGGASCVGRADPAGVDYETVPPTGVLQASAARGSVRRGHRCPALGVQAAGGPPSAEPAG